MQYTQDYDETYPNRDFDNGAGRWNQVIQPYVKSTQLFQCPSNPHNKEVNVGAQNGYPPINISYGINGWIMRTTGEGNGISMAAINSSSQKVLVTEGIYGWSDYGKPDWTGPANWVNSGYAGHLNTENFLYVYGHVKALRPTGTATPVNAWGSINGTASPGCNGGDVNCDVPEPTMVDGMQQLTNKYK